MREQKTAFIAFVKYPLPGQVKSRLAAGIGEDNAALIYRAVADKILSEAEKISDSCRTLFIFYPNKDHKEHMESWTNKNDNLYCQEGKDLGERMNNAISYTLNIGFNKAILFGSDIPDLNSAVLLSAEKLLDNNDIVIGPAKDGGYYLIGMKSIAPSIFNFINWSTQNVYQSTLERIHLQNLEYSDLQLLSDIDSIEDLRNWLSINGADEVLFPLFKNILSESKQYR